MHSAKFTNDDGKNPFRLAYALMASERTKANRQFFENLAKAKEQARIALNPKIEFAKDGSCTAYMVYVE